MKQFLMLTIIEEDITSSTGQDSEYSSPVAIAAKRIFPNEKVRTVCTKDSNNQRIWKLYIGTWFNREVYIIPTECRNDIAKYEMWRKPEYLKSKTYNLFKL